MTEVVDNSTTIVNQTVIKKEEPPKQVGVILSTMSAFWDWFDQRDVEKHIVAAFTLFMTFIELRWGMRFSEQNAARSGVEIAAILAAIGVPITAFQTAVLGFYFRSRTGASE